VRIVVNKNHDPFLECIKAGRPIDCGEVVDTHLHLGDLGRNLYIRPNADGLLESMDRLGIDRGIVSSSTALAIDVDRGNNEVAELTAMYPDRFMGYAVVNPYDLERVAKTEKWLNTPGFVGIKIHSMIGIQQDDPIYAPIFELGEVYRCPMMLIHTWGTQEVNAADTLAQRYPEARMILAHAGGNLRFMPDCIPLVKKHPNVYIDIALSMGYMRNIEWFCRDADPSKVLFGSDMPCFDPGIALGRLAWADIPVETKRAIFAGNANRLLCERKNAK
jgi:predicted TIM-barrel fold metal-dependent hydrolase